MLENRSPKDLVIMETNKKQKIFDAVKTKRDIRDEISTETQNMSFEELKAFIEKQLKENKTNLLDITK
jgi:CO dehydrogenase/acetyl-CoA synthase beta subunit